MLIRPEWSGCTLIVKSDSNGLVFAADGWPQRRLRIEHMLEALCGQAVDGWYVYHEMDCRWISYALQSVLSLTNDNIAVLGIMDLVQAGDSPSRQAAGSYAVKLFMVAMLASESEAIRLVRMNMRAMER